VRWKHEPADGIEVERPHLATHHLTFICPERTAVIITSATPSSAISQGLFSHPYIYELYEKSDQVVDHRISRDKLFRDPFDQIPPATAD
jgi:hypothetical protein